jgi:cell division protein FtsB
MDLAKGERDPIRLNAIATVLTFILALVGTVASVGSLMVAVEQLELDKASQASDQQNFKHILASVQATQADIETSRRELTARDRQLRYVHERAPLRLEPHREGPTIRFVYSDQVLRALEEQGDWLKVEVYDYQSEGSTIGWISRRRVRIQPLD